MNLDDLLHFFQLQKHCYRLCGSILAVLFGTVKDFCLPSSQNTPQTPLHRIFFNSFFTSFVKFDVFSVAPLPSQEEPCAQQCCRTVLFYSGRQLSLRYLNRESCSSQQFLPTLKSVHTAHHPLSGTHSCLCTKQHSSKRFLSFHFSCIYSIKAVCIKVHLAHTYLHTHTTSITVTILRKNLSISPTTDDSIYNSLPIKISAYAPSFSLFTTPHKSSESFY